MLKNYKKFLSMLLAILLFVSVTAIGQSTANADNPVTLSIVLYGSEGADSAKIFSLINEKLTKDLNVTLEPVWLGSADSAGQMSLLFSAGEKMDLVYIAGWFAYKDYASKNAYAELTMDEIKEFAPLTYEAVTDAEWLQTQVNGKIFCVPEKTDMTSNDRLVTIRGDLREKYGLAPLETWEDLEVYIEKALADEDEAFTSSGGMEGFQSHLLRDKYGWAEFDRATGIWYDLNEVQNGVYKMFDFVMTDEFVGMCKTMRSYFEKGYWASDEVANYSSANTADNVSRFNSAIVPMLSANYSTTLSSEKTLNETHPEWKVEVYGLNDTSLSSARPAINDGMAVAMTSENKELCLKVIDLLRNDPDYHHLLMYGVEGENWKYADEEKTSFISLAPFDFGCNWGFKNSYAELQDASAPEDILAIKQRWADNGRTIQNPVNAFTFDKTGLETEMAQIADVYTEYYWPLYYGMYEDVDGAVTQFRKAMEGVGLNTVLDALNSQLDAFAVENDLK